MNTLCPPAMAILSPDIVLALSNQSSWVTGDGQALLPRLEAVLQGLPPDVAGWIVDQLLEDPDRARALLQGLALAAETGLEPVGHLGEGRVHLRDAEGHELALGVLTFAAPAHPKGHPDDVARLVALLDATFQGRQYALYLRRAIPSGFDPGPVARAAHLWLAAIDRGEWKGRHAIYEDDAVALELTLVKRQAEAGGRVMTVGPVNALERLGEVDSQVVDLTQRHRQVSELPLVIALSAQPAWRVPRGYVEQLLYGTADQIEATEGAYSARFTSNGRSLFSDPACAPLCQLWWLEAGSGDALSFRAWAHDNPWTNTPEATPPVDVDRFVANHEERVGEGVRNLRWSRREPRNWQGA